MNKNIQNILLIGLLVFAAILRLWKLGFVPTGVTHDEMGYIYNAYSIATTGKNVFGESLPFLTWMVKGGFPFLPVPIYLAAPVFWVLPLSAFSGRLLPALLGLGDVLLIYIIIRQLFKRVDLALLSALFVSISPWHLHFSRSAYDVNYALFFFLLFIALFLYEIQKKRVPIFSIVSLILAIFSYRGMNAIFPPLVLLLLWYGVIALKITKRQLIAFLLGNVVVFCTLFLVIRIYGKPYIAEANIFGNPKMTEDIDIQIREAQGPLFIRRLYLNKVTYVLNSLRENYIRSYSPEFLFLYSEPSKIYSIWSRGRIYFFDLFLIFLGIAYLYRLNKQAGIFVIGLLLIGGIPGMVSGFPYSSRNFFLAAILPVFVAGGALFLYNLVNGKKRLLVAFCILLVYMFLLGGYLFDYYGRYALYSGEAWVKSLSEVSDLIETKKDNFDRVVVGTTSFGDFVQYAFYTKIPATKVQNAWRDRKENTNGFIFSLGNVEFEAQCLTNDIDHLPSQLKESMLYIAHDNCYREASASAVIRDYQKNTVWKIYEISKNIH